MVLMVYGKVHACGYISLTATWHGCLAEKGLIIGGFGWRGLVLGENLGVSGSGSGSGVWVMESMGSRGLWGSMESMEGFGHGVHGGEPWS